MQRRRCRLAPRNRSLFPLCALCLCGLCVKWRPAHWRKWTQARNLASRVLAQDHRGTEDTERKPEVKHQFVSLRPD
jgi:hypothetical protein